MASTSPLASIVSLSGGSMLTQLILPRSRLLAAAKIGNALRPASNTGAPSFLPVRSAGVLIPDFFSAKTAAGVLL